MAQRTPRPRVAAARGGHYAAAPSIETTARAALPAQNATGYVLGDLVLFSSGKADMYALPVFYSRRLSTGRDRRICGVAFLFAVTGGLVAGLGLISSAYGILSILLYNRLCLLP